MSRQRWSMAVRTAAVAVMFVWLAGLLPEKGKDLVILWFFLVFCAEKLAPTNWWGTTFIEVKQ